MIKKIKGTQDLLFNDVVIWQKLEEKIKFFLENYNYKEIRTPIIEFSEIFYRTSTYSDMVQKETYNFVDKKKRIISLRPEGTAGIIRSYIENKLDLENKINKFYYIGPFFRYERPQKGRYRQFHQIGVELLGDSSSFIDLEIIVMISEMLKFLNFHNFKININTLGDDESYAKYIKVLKDYVIKNKDFLCSLCQKRIFQNTLRILDCKICSQKDFLQKEVPIILDFLNQFSKNRFDVLIDGLKFMNINFEICPKLVRGLDYYNHTVFEIVALNNVDEKNNILGGGGCYDKLVETLGGNKTSGIGFALGIERLVSFLKANKLFLDIDLKKNVDVYFLFLESKLFFKSLLLLNQLRNEGIKGEINYNFVSFSKQLKKGLMYHPKYFIILGEKENSNNEISLKNISNKKQIKLSQDKIVHYLKKEFNLCK